MPDQQLLTTKEAAAYLSVSTGTLQNWRSEGLVDLPYLKLGGRPKGPVRYRLSDLDAYLKKNTRTHT